MSWQSAVCLIRTDVAAAIGFFTRLPVGMLMPANPSIDMARASWAFPIAGGLVGLFGAAIYAACACLLGLSPWLASCCTFGLTLLLTGALHEDGLADMVDGFSGGRDRESKLTIMRDSRIGAYGALALLLSSLVRIGAISDIGAPKRVAVALLVSGIMSRCAIVLLLVLLRPARTDGVSASLSRIPGFCMALTGATAIGSSLLLHGWMRLVVPFCAGMTVMLIERVTMRQIGGHTGDVLGGCAVLVECITLMGL